MKKAYRSNVIDVISNASKTLSQHWTQLAAATAVAVFSILCLNLLPLFGFALSFFASGLISIGYVQFVLGVLRKKNPPVENVFAGYKQMFSAFALRLVMCLFVFLWSLLFIVPGIVAAINYSFAMTAMSENPKLRALDALDESKRLVSGYRDVILCIYLMTFLFMLLIYIAMLAIPLLFAIFLPIQIWQLFVIAAVLSVCAYAILLIPFMECALLSVFEEAKKMNKEQSATKKKSVEKVEDLPQA